MSDRIFEHMQQPPPRASGWWLLSWPLFQQQFDGLVAGVERLRDDDPSGYRHHPKAKLLATILRLITEEVPRDPGPPPMRFCVRAQPPGGGAPHAAIGGHENFRQGNTLGHGFTSWYRAKFHQRYRLFYRFDSKAKAIIYAWVNVEGGLRKAGDKNDPYAVFRRMLERGTPPTSFHQLLNEADSLRLPGTEP